jgi:hypothetical protein
MKTSFSNKHLGLAVSCALALGIASGAAQAQVASGFGPNADRELWTTTGGTQIWKNGFGECWHSAFGPPPPSAECDPKPAVAQYVAPPPPPASAECEPARVAQFVAPAPPPPPPVVQAPRVAPPAPAPIYIAPIEVKAPPPIERPRRKDRN